MKPPESYGGFERHTDQKIIELHELFARRDIPHAFGGAIALAYYGEPRATKDVDVNVFLPIGGRFKTLIAINDELVPIKNPGHRFMDIEQFGGTTIKYGRTDVDLFFSFTDFHDSVAQRAKVVDFKGTEIPILSMEDLIVFKTIFSRTEERKQDWPDIESIYEIQAGNIDQDYVMRWLREFIKEEGDPRLGRIKALGEQYPT